MAHVFKLDFATLNSMTASAHTMPLSNLASHLIHDGLLDIKTATRALHEARRQNTALISYLVKNNILKSTTIAASCSTSLGLPIFDLHNYDINLLKNTLLSIEMMRYHRIVPLKIENKALHIGISDPMEQQTIDTLQFHTGLTILPFVVDENKLDYLIQTHLNNNAPHQHFELSILKDLSSEENNINIQENQVSYDEPVIRFVDYIIQHALQKSASDIHIEPYEKICRIRYRQDGILYTASEIPSKLASRIATRLKVISKLDISERRLPQDGRFQSHNMDIRINSCPTLFGEKIVLRLLDSNKTSLNIDELGFTVSQKNIFLEKISEPQGLILVTGPTGSGKTVTLYSALHHLNQLEKNISTVEDPVEIQVNGINQVHINPKINLTFSTALRSFLRQDPDIIMVGEIRDAETAEIAIQAAQTGHLVLSTVHTNSAVETLARLQSMGIAAYNLQSAISLIIAQRLIRKLCPHCKQPENRAACELSDMGFPPSKKIIYRAIGCQHCLLGYQGRIGIYELLPITESISQLITSHTNSRDIQAYAKRYGFMTLREAGFEKVMEGVTSLTEINRVTTL